MEKIVCGNCHSVNMQKKVVLSLVAICCKECKTLELKDEFAHLKTTKLA